MAFGVAFVTVARPSHDFGIQADLTLAGRLRCSVKAKDLSGQTWRVTRRWVPWRRRLKGEFGGGSFHSLPDVGDDPISAIILAVILLPFIVLAVVVAFEFLLVLALLPVAVLARVALGRKWAVEARRGWVPWWEESVGNWSASKARIEEVAAAIERGQTPARTIDVPEDEVQGA